MQKFRQKQRQCSEGSHGTLNLSARYRSDPCTNQRRFPMICNHTCWSHRSHTLSLYLEIESERMLQSLQKRSLSKWMHSMSAIGIKRQIRLLLCHRYSIRVWNDSGGYHWTNSRCSDTHCWNIISNIAIVNWWIANYQDSSWMLWVLFKNKEIFLNFIWINKRIGSESIWWLYS